MCNYVYITTFYLIKTTCRQLNYKCDWIFILDQLQKHLFLKLQVNKKELRVK